MLSSRLCGGFGFALILNLFFCMPVPAMGFDPNGEWPPPFKAYSPDKSICVFLFCTPMVTEDQLRDQYKELLHDIRKSASYIGPCMGILKKDKDGMYGDWYDFVPGGQGGLIKAVFSPTNKHVVLFYDWLSKYSLFSGVYGTRFWVCDIEQKQWLLRTIETVRDLPIFTDEKLKRYYYLVSDGLAISDDGVLSFKTSLDEEVKYSVKDKRILNSSLLPMSEVKKRCSAKP